MMAFRTNANIIMPEEERSITASGLKLCWQGDKPSTKIDGDDLYTWTDEESGSIVVEVRISRRGRFMEMKVIDGQHIMRFIPSENEHVRRELYYDHVILKYDTENGIVIEKTNTEDTIPDYGEDLDELIVG